MTGTAADSEETSRPEEGFLLPGLARAVRDALPNAGGADHLAERLEPLVAAEANIVQAFLAKLVEVRLIESYRTSRPRAGVAIDPAVTRANCRAIADEVVKDSSFFGKLARWVAVNVCFWLWEGDTVDSIDDEAVGSLVRIYAESSAQALGEMMSPPRRPVEQLEEILGIGRGGARAIDVADLQQDMLVVLSTGHFQGLREALYKNTFRKMDGTLWPTAALGKAGAKCVAQLRPVAVDGLASLPREQMEGLAQTMWRQQSELSDRDADALDALCAIYLSQAHGPDDSAVADVDQLLALRGLQPKRGGAGRRGGYEPEQREEMLRALTHVQNLWIDMAEVTVYEPDEKGRPGKRPVIKSLQSRPFIITDRMGQTRSDGELDVERFVFRPGKAFAAFLFGSGRQTGLLFRKALQYDPYRKRWEKRLTRYISWHWAATGGHDLVQSHTVEALLDVVGETVNERYPGKTRCRFEAALATMSEDGIIAGWSYGQPYPAQDRHNWAEAWMTTEVRIEAPQVIRQFYAASPPGGHALSGESGLGAQLRAYRRRLGLTQIEAARSLGIRQGHLSKLETGKASPSSDLQATIEAWLRGANGLTRLPASTGA